MAKWKKASEEEIDRICRDCGNLFIATGTKKLCVTCRNAISKISAIKAAEVNKKNYKIGQLKKNNQGYMLIWTGNDWKFQHRILMEQKINRPLEKHETVHHKNGIRHDNSLDNLELWVGGIRYGQRAEDVKCHHCGTPYKIT